MEALKGAEGPIVAASDYMKALPDSVRPWVPHAMLSLGTDGFGRSESRETLRDFFEVDAKHIVWAALVLLNREGKFPTAELDKTKSKIGINPDKADPAIS